MIRNGAAWAFVVLFCAVLLLTGCTAFEPPYESHSAHWHDRAVKRMFGSPLDDSLDAVDARAATRGW